MVLVLCFLSQSVLAKKEFSIEGSFKSYCIECHGMKGKVKGEVNLISFTEGKDLRSDPELLHTIMEVIDFGEMPPEENQPFDNTERKMIVAELKKLLAESVSGSEEDLIKAPIRRMTRFQYANAVKDLLELKVEVFPLPEKMMRDRSGYFKPASGKMPAKMMVSSRPLGKSGLIEPRMDGVAPFPQDLRAEHGYDTQGDHLSLSPLLMEDFFRLSQSIVKSPSFNPKNVGVWTQYFEKSKREINQTDELKSRLQHLLKRAFRAPVDDKTFSKYYSFAEQEMNKGMGMGDAMKDVFSAILASPRFLYLYDRGGEGSREPESRQNLDLASRLSFFLWGSVPDDQLLEVAMEATLRQDEQLTRQVDRMLADEKLKRFCDSFPTQWLQLDRIISAVPDEKKYRDFYYGPPLYRTTMDMMMLIIVMRVMKNDPTYAHMMSSTAHNPTQMKMESDRI